MISKTLKEQLAEHFKNRDIYIPAEAPEQQTSDFMPKMCMGGEAKGYAGGGDVGIDLGDLGASLGNSNSGGFDISNSADTDTFKQKGLNDGLNTVVRQPKAIQMPQNAPTMRQEATSGPQPGFGEPGEEAGPISEPSEDLTQGQTAKTAGLEPNQYDELVKALSARPSIGQSAMSGLAGLADAISTGVARAGNPGFQRNIMESQQNQRQNLINALTAKYGHERALQELGLNKARLGEEQRHNIQGEKETEKARQLTAAQQGVEMARLGQQQAHQTEEEKAKNVELQQKGSGLINSIERKLGFGPPLPNTTNGPKDLYSTPQAQAIKQQYQQGKITKAQANQLLDKLHGPR